MCLRTNAEKAGFAHLFNASKGMPTHTQFLPLHFMTPLHGFVSSCHPGFHG